MVFLALVFSNTVLHLGNILSSDLSDSEDILSKCRDMLTKINTATLLSSFPNLNPSILTNLFQSYSLSLHGSALWNTFSRSLQTLEVSFNKILRRIWKLPHASHTAIVHCTARLHIILSYSTRFSNVLTSSSAQQKNVLLTLLEQFSSNPLSSATPQLATTSWLYVNLPKFTQKLMLKVVQYYYS